jgi:PAS domain S-box-containing protein
VKSQNAINSKSWLEEKSQGEGNLAASAVVFSEKTLINILNSIDEGMFLIGLDGTVLEANDAVLKLHQVLRDECVGRPLEYFVNPQDRQRLRESLQMVLSKGVIRDEIKALRRDRSIFPAELTLSLLKDDSGEPLAIVGIIQDRTQRMRAQQQIEKTTSELTALMKSSTEIIRTTDLHQRLKVIAQAIHGLGWQRVLITLTDRNWETTDIVSVGLTQEEEKYLWEQRQPGDVWRQRLGSKFNRYKLGEFYYLPWSDPFVRNHFKTGTVNSKLPKEEMLDWNPQDLLYAPLRLPEGHLVGRISIDDPVDGRRPTKESLSPLGLFVHQAAVAIENAYLIRDLETARNQIKEYAEQLEQKVEERTSDLRRSQEKLKSIFDASPDAITLSDLNGIIIECNQAALEINGCERREDMIGKSALEFIAEKDQKRAMENLKTTFGKGSTKNIEYTCLTKKNEEFPAEISASVIRDALGNPVAFVEILKDISERKRMEQQLLTAERFAAIGELATMVGHDLRNPLTGIVGAAYFLKMRLGSQMSRKELEMLELIEKDIEYSNKIVNDLLDFSRDIRLNKTKITINSVVKETLSHMQIPRKVKISNQTGKTAAVFVDLHQMNRVFENIIKNALDAMPTGGKLEIKSEKKGNWLHVAFKDTGEGIPKENLSKLGSPLFTTKAKGVGMGLAICRRLVEAHGGSVSIESEHGVGTCVTVILPVESDSQTDKERNAFGGEK